MRLDNKTKELVLDIIYTPETHGVYPDVDGWVDLDKLRSALSLSNEKLNRLIECGDIFRLGRGGTQIRALNVLPKKFIKSGLIEEATPPELLYHGLNASGVPSARIGGLHSSGRPHTRLYADRLTARHTADVRAGAVSSVVVFSGVMHRENFNFLKYKDIWLIKSIPASYLDA